jgi:hypothetical protein
MSRRVPDGGDGSAPNPGGWSAEAKVRAALIARDRMLTQSEIQKVKSDRDLAHRKAAAYDSDTSAVKIARSRAKHPDHLMLSLRATSDHYDFCCSECDEKIEVSAMEATA